MLANYAYTDARVTEDTLIPVGDKLPRVPQNSGRVAGRHCGPGHADRLRAIGVAAVAADFAEVAALLA